MITEDMEKAIIETQGRGECANYLNPLPQETIDRYYGTYTETQRAISRARFYDARFAAIFGTQRRMAT